MHKRNKHKNQYDFDVLSKAHPPLKTFVSKNKYVLSIDFFNPKAVLALNTAILKSQYNISYWNLPENYLCPPIPGRADYIHHIADLLASDLKGRIPKGNQVRCLDIGTGANCIYPLLGLQSYNWSFVASDIDSKALSNAQEIITKNKFNKQIILHKQSNPKQFFEGVLKEDEIFAVSLCNPPFHASAKEAAAVNLRKNKNLKGDHSTQSALNFGGQAQELWCVGGEKQFIHDMIKESEVHQKSCIWFTTLVSKESNLKGIEKQLQKTSAVDFRLIPM